MGKQTRAKQERVIEAVRHGLEGDAAVEFIRKSGYAMTSAGVARHLRAMGGRGPLQEAIAAGKSNLEILQERFPGDDEPLPAPEPPSQTELFPDLESAPGPNRSTPAFENTKISLTLPTDVYLALRFAAKAENKTQTQLVTEILTTALSRMPRLPEEDGAAPE